MFNIPEDHNETTGNYVAIDLKQQQAYDDQEPFKRKISRKLTNKQRSSKRVIDMSTTGASGEDSVKRKVSRVIKREDGSIVVQKSQNFNRLSEATPASNLDLFENIAADHGFEQLAST